MTILKLANSLKGMCFSGTPRVGRTGNSNNNSGDNNVSQSANNAVDKIKAKMLEVTDYQMQPGGEIVYKSSAFNFGARGRTVLRMGGLKGQLFPLSQKERQKIFIDEKVKAFKDKKTLDNEISDTLSSLIADGGDSGLKVAAGILSKMPEDTAANFLSEISKTDPQSAANILSEISNKNLQLAANIINLLTNGDSTKQAAILSEMPEDTAAEFLFQMDTRSQADILLEMDDLNQGFVIAAMTNRMHADDIDILLGCSENFPKNMRKCRNISKTSKNQKLGD